MDEQSIFTAALERDVAVRREYLDEACEGNLELRRRVEKLLAAHEKAASFLDQPAGELAVTITDKPRHSDRSLQVAGADWRRRHGRRLRGRAGTTHPA